MRRPSLLRRPVPVLLAAVLLAGCAATPPPAPPPPPPAVEAVAPPSPVRLLLKLRERRLYLLHHDPETPAESFPIAIGKPGTETPTGSFHVEELVVDPDFTKYDRSVDPPKIVRRIPPGAPDNPLGKRWIGITHGPGWTLGIHGTPRPELLGQAVSNGCVRMRNADVVRIYERVQLGTPVVVEE
ncbi:MAG: L,D-transpeptidase [bacterium]|nr:L,D-transpeptidase [bacterium]